MKIRERLQNYKHVLKIATKPSKDEFFSAARICAIGMAVIGLIGFLIYLIAVLINL